MKEPYCGRCESLRYRAFKEHTGHYFCSRHESKLSPDGRCVLRCVACVDREGIHERHNVQSE